MDVSGKIIVVTGGASGIGRALVERFVHAGARHVVIADRDPTEPLGVTTSVRQTDVSDEQQIRALVDETEANIGPIDLYCNNAGILPVDPDWNDATSTPDREWDLTWKVNVMAHVWSARALLPRMIARGGGYFVQTVSAAGLLAQIGGAAYTTTKHAAIGFAESLAITHKDHGIRVSIVCPQAVATAMIDGKPMNGADVNGVISPTQVADATLAGIAGEQFLILPHPDVATYVQGKAHDHGRWIGGMAKLRRTLRT